MGAGTINDIARISKIVRDAGALSYVDAVQLAPHVPIDKRPGGGIASQS